MKERTIWEYPFETLQEAKMVVGRCITRYIADWVIGRLGSGCPV